MQANPQDTVNAPASLGTLSVRKAAALLVVLLVIVAVVYASPLRNYLNDARQISADIRQAGRMAPVLFMVGVGLLVAVGIPRLLLCAIGGMTFGFVNGLLWSQVGTLLGYYLVFLYIRWGGRAFVRRFDPTVPGWASIMARRGTSAVILARQLPVHGFVVNAALAISPVRQRDFLVGTAIGLLPEAVPCALIGSGTLRATFAQSAGIMALAVAALALVWMGLGMLRERLNRDRVTAPR